MWNCPKEKWFKLVWLKNRNSAILNSFHEYRKLFVKCYISMAGVRIVMLLCNSSELPISPLLQAVITLTHCMPLVSFIPPENIRMFSGGIESDHWHEMNKLNKFEVALKSQNKIGSNFRPIIFPLYRARTKELTLELLLHLQMFFPLYVKCSQIIQCKISLLICCSFVFSDW